MSFILHVQQGGSSREMYLHSHDSDEEADTCRAECEKAAYKVGPDHVVDEDMSVETCELIEELIRDAVDLNG